MAEIFRIESPRVTVRWASLSARPATLGSEDGHEGYLVASPAERCSVIVEAGSKGAGSSPMPKLFEQVDYRLAVRLKAGAGSRVDIRHRDPDLLRGLLPPDETQLDLRVGTLNFRNQVGRSRFDVLVDGQHELTFEVEVFPSKLDYREDFEQILAEIQSVLTALAFDYLKATNVSAQRTHEPPTALEWALQLRSVVDDLERAMRHIAARPIRGLRREPLVRRADRVRRVDSAVRRAVRTGAGEGPWLTLDAGMRVRSRVPTTHTESTLDTAEHRWLAEHLGRVQTRLAQLVGIELGRGGGSARRDAAVSELKTMEVRIGAMLRLEPMVATTMDPPQGFSSLQLLGAAGYREAYRALVSMQLGLRLEGNALELSLKDISTLYEYWCYLALLRLVAEKTGCPIDARDVIRVESSGLRVLLSKGQTSATSFQVEGAKVTVTYNPRFDSNVLLSQQPDIVVAVDEPGWPTVRVVLDAKYRVDPSPENVKQLGIAGPPADALNVLHRYRDAILTEEQTPNDGKRLSRSVVYAASLYPLDVDEPTFERSKLHQQLRTVGIGAIPFLPSNPGLLSRWLDELLGLDRWGLAQAAIPTAPEPWVWRASSEVVLVGVLRSAKAAEAAAHLEWVQANRTYYLPRTEARHRRHLNASYVALYLPKSLASDGVGAVSLIGKIEESETVPRGAISTPWTPRDQREPTIRYRVKDWQPLRTPVRNDEGQRFSESRWSTRLAVERAVSLAQLSLESPLEWALHDALKAQRTAFRVQANEVRAVAPEPTRGRARFVMADGRVVTYVGASGFEVRTGDAVCYPTTVQRVAAYLGRASVGAQTSLPDELVE